MTLPHYSFSFFFFRITVWTWIDTRFARDMYQVMYEINDNDNDDDDDSDDHQISKCNLSEYDHTLLTKVSGPINSPGRLSYNLDTL